MKPKELCLWTLTLVSLMLMTSQDMEDSYYASLIDFLYENYPKFIPRLLAYNGTTVGGDLLVVNSTGYRGGLMRETKFKDGYGILVANTFRVYYENGEQRTAKADTNVMYKCHTAIRYCSGNAAYCRYHEGERGTQIIIVAGHDGALKPDSIPDRDVGCWLPKAKKCHYRHECEDSSIGVYKDRKRCGVDTLADMGTTSIAEYLQDAFKDITGKRPHLIVNRLHRKKMDVNRPLPVGTFHVDEAVKAYRDVHGFIQRAIGSIEGEWGLILDIHGNNRQKKTMLGYGLSTDQYQRGYFVSKDSTIQHLADHVKERVSLEKLVRGRNSLGAVMEKRGMAVVPSPMQPVPDEGSYLWGGFIVRAYGSMGGRKVDAIQIEIPNSKRENNVQTISNKDSSSSDETDQERYLNELAESVQEYIEMNYNKKGKGADPEWG